MVVQPAGGSACTPTLLQERTMSAVVSQVAICPSMDLVAVVLDKVSVAIFRTTWQRLATIPVSTQPDRQITALAWSPDGANLAVATSAADLTILSVDRSAFASTGKAKRAARDTAGPIATVSLPAPAACLSWAAAPAEGSTDDAGVGDRYEDRAAQLLHTTDEFGPHSAGLIFVGDRDGFLSIMTHVLLFTIARLRVMPPRCSLDGLRLTPDLRYCFVFGHEVLGEVATSLPGEVRCAMRSVDLGHVLDFWPEIERVGREVVALTSFVKQMEKAAEQINECWVNGAAEVTKSAIITPLTKLMKDFAESRSKHPWEMLHNVFCGASVNGAVLQFLAAELSENGAKEALRAFRSHVDDIFDTLHSLLPVAENTVVRASEYRALARMTSRFSPVGVYFDNANTLFELTESLYLALGDLTWEVERVSNETEAFLAWLVIAAARAGGDSMQGRGSAAMGNIKGEDARLVSQFFQSVTEGSMTAKGSVGMDAVTEKYNDCIQPAVGKYRNLCRDWLAQPSVAISSSLTIDEGISVSVTTTKRERRTKFCIAGVGETSLAGRQMYVVIVTGEGKVVCVQHDFAGQTWSLSHRSFLSEKFFIHDASLFLKSKAAFLISESPTGDFPELVEGKVSCVLSIHEFNPLDFAGHGIQVSRDQEDRTISLPEVVPLTQQHIETVEAGQLESSSELSLSIDSGRRIAR